MGKKRRIIFLLIILNLFTLSGCWDIREINELGLVTAVGIDKADSPNKYSVTVQIANPNTSSSSDGQSNAKSELWIGTEEGTSIFEAVRKLANVSSRRVMWAHNTVVIIGESLAKEGIIPVADYFAHNPELRMKAAVVVAYGDAKEYVAAKVGMESPPGISFILLESYRSLSAESTESHMLQVCAALKNEYANPLISKISLKKEAMQAENSKSTDEKNSETVALSGAAVFKKDKMIGWLSPEEVRGASWILNQTKNTVVTVIDPEHGNKSVSVETKGMKAKIRTKVTDGMPEISISMSGTGDIVEEDGSTTQSMNEMKEHVTELINKKIEDEIGNSLEIMQKKYMVDCFGFAAFVHVQNAREWNNGLKDNWQEIFAQIPVTVSVSISIESSTLSQEPMKIF